LRFLGLRAEGNWRSGAHQLFAGNDCAIFQDLGTEDAGRMDAGIPGGMQ